MRNEPAILVVALAVGALGCFTVAFFGFSPWPMGVGFGLIIGLVVFVGLLMAQNAGIAVRELVKQIAVWLAIVTLLPLTVWYGTSAFSPPPDRKPHDRATSRIDEKIKESTDPAAKENLRQERERLEDELEEAERIHYGHKFWVAYPVGLAAFVVGTFFFVQTVAAGLMFGGLFALTAGCYAYWDRMGDWLRFGSLIVALIVVLVLGIWRFWPVAQASHSNSMPA
jgi:hypothetical protein